MPQKVAPTFDFKIPRMVCRADVAAGMENLKDVMDAIQPARTAIAQAENEMLLISTCDAIENVKELETVSVKASRHSDNGNEEYVNVSVSCEYTPSEEISREEEAAREEMEDELIDVLSEVGEEINNSDLNDDVLPPKEFISKLAVLLLGEEPARSWFAARERATLAQVVPKTGKSSGQNSL